MYAVIKSGGKQYRVSEGDVVSLEKLPGKVGGKVTFSEVLAVSGKGGALKLGTPTVAKAKVEGERRNPRNRQSQENPRVKVQKEQPVPNPPRPPAALHQGEDQQDFGLLGAPCALQPE